MVSFLKDRQVFISYRRDDTEDIAHRLYKKLLELGVEKSKIFFDRHDIPGGAHFPDHLREQLVKCDVILVLIGKHYFSIQPETGKSRLHDPEDWVREEIRYGLSTGKTVVPVVFEDDKIARTDLFPGKTRLPTAIADLSKRQAHFIRSGQNWDADVRNLARDLGLTKNVISNNWVIVIALLAGMAYLVWRFVL